MQRVHSEGGYHIYLMLNVTSLSLIGWLPGRPIALLTLPHSWENNTMFQNGEATTATCKCAIFAYIIISPSVSLGELG